MYHENSCDKRWVFHIKKNIFLHREYARRKFQLDIANGTIDMSTWRDCYYSVFRCLVDYFVRDYFEVNGVMRDKNEVLHDRGIFKFHGECGNMFFLHMNSIIAIYNNSLSGDPAVQYRIFPSKFDEIYYDVIYKRQKEVDFLRNTCVKYGYFPADLHEIRDYSSFIETFEAGNLPEVEPFLLVDSRP